MKTKISRRTTLRGIIGGAATAIALPRLDSMLNGNGTAYASGAPLPKRFGVWAWANGAHADTFFPTMPGDNPILPEEIAALAPVKANMMIVGGMSVPYAPGRGHAGPHTHLMTGSPTDPVSMTGVTKAYIALTPSIDQLVAAQIGNGTLVKSLQVGVDQVGAPESGSCFHWWSHSGQPGAMAPNPCSYNCKDVFDKLFGGLGPMTTTPPPAPGAPAGPSASAIAAMKRQSILDTVKGDAGELRLRLGSNDKKRLDQHLEGIRGIENRLALLSKVTEPGIVSADCKKPAAPDPGLGGQKQSYDVAGRMINKTMSELVAMAFACDITRVVTFELCQPGSNMRAPSVGMNDAYHGVTHGPWTGAGCRGMVKLFMSELSVFIQTLQSTPEGAGSVLDNCAIMASTDCNTGPSHGSTNYPILTFGKAGGLRTNYYYQSPSAENACLVSYTLGTAVGATLGTFGKGAGAVSAPLSALMK